MSDNRRYKKFDLKNISTQRFTMTALELKDYIPFEVKRVYFVTSPIGPERITGSHCHIKFEDELFVLITGKATLVVDDGHGLENMPLEGPKQAVYIPHMVWHQFKDLSDDAVLMAITSTNYNPDRYDYCEDYTKFTQLLSEKGLILK